VQGWNGSAWLTSYKDSNTYDGNNNQIEQFHQWGGSPLVKRWSYIYDENNNKTEELSQDWDGSAWLNSSKTIYSYIPTEVE
jgi:hypothetical protein